MENYDDLSPLGIQQAKYLGSVLKQRNLFPQKVFAGSMFRQQQTAEHCLSELGLEMPIQTEPAWNEFDHRNIIAKFDERYADMNQVKLDVMSAADPKEKIKEILTGAVSRWTSGSHDDYNESWWAFCKRIESGLQNISANTEKKENIFVFTSGGSISAVMKQLLDLPIQKTFELQLYTANASITKIKTSSRGLQLVSFNDHSHFEGEKKNLLTFR
jgi:broad specificity phosphatase PhoE